MKVNLTKHQKRVYYLGVKVLNMLSSYIKTLSDNPKKFKLILQIYLCENSCYSLHEYFELKSLNLFIYDLNYYLKLWHIK